MHVLIKLALIGGIFVAVIAAYVAHEVLKTYPPPVLDEPYWGPLAQVKDDGDTSIRPFKINVSDEALQDLKNRLNKARPITPALEDSKHHYGINSALTKEILQFWKTKYDWRQREKFLNQYPQYKTKIQGLDIHYIHVKPKVASNVKVLPLLLVHGWPGSVREFYEMIPMLTADGNNFVFELIIPSLPGYGFSDSASKQGLGAPQTAVIFKNLMQRLGFDQYYVQGGDWGSVIVTEMSIMYPSKILGMHSNMCMSQAPISTIKLFIGNFIPALMVDAEHEEQMYPLSEKFKMYMLEFGYFHLQATKPDTVGIGLNDSPLGMAAYILEKFIAWTDMDYKDREDGGLKQHYNYEDLLDNVMIYWITNSMTTSMRMYAESVNSKQHFMNDRHLVQVPSACARFRGEIAYMPDFILRDKFVNLVHSADYSRGGHFAAFQEPKLLSGDIWKAVAKMERKREQKV